MTTPGRNTPVPIETLEDTRQCDAILETLLQANTSTDALQHLRTLWVERLGFSSATTAIPLPKKDALPDVATIIAKRSGVNVVALVMPQPGRVTTTIARDALTEIEKLLGDVLLVVANNTRTEWHFIYPGDLSGRGGHVALRRMVVRLGEPRRTVAQQLSGIYDNLQSGTAVHIALDHAYDVEAVAKRFFQEYRRVFGLVNGLVTGLPDEERKLFCQTLVNRLMFLYFLQRKGWLTYQGDHDYLNALWKAPGEGTGANFYQARLRPLFFTALATEHGHEPDPVVGTVPFLNGGLFAEGPLDQRPGLTVPNEAIGLILEDLFDPFNFTVAESTPYDVEVAVDPEMLGKVFEELVTGRHEKGSYYTPRPIVTFMCREALKGYLTTPVPKEPKGPHEPHKPSEPRRPSEPLLSVAVAASFVDKRSVSDITVEQAPRLIQALESITVADPACGSGAYLLGMLHELVDLRSLLYSEKLVKDPKSLYQLKLQVIARNLYGVDKDDFAVNVAKLRLWLSLIIDFDGPSTPPPLPNLDFKIVCGDSLLAPDPASSQQSEMFLTLAHKDAAELSGKKEAFLQATGANKHTLHQEILEIRGRLTSMLRTVPAPGGSVDWRVEFAEVFDQNGGFDVALANPPYVRQELIKDIKPGLLKAYGSLYAGTADLYVFFYYRALQLMKPGGMLVFISSNKWFKAAYGARLRKAIAETTTVRSVTDFGDLPVFVSATAYPMIFIAEKNSSQSLLHYTQPKTLEPPYPDMPALIDRDGTWLSHNVLKESEWSFSSGQSAKLTGMPLGEYVGGKIYSGIKTGFNQAFVIDGAKRDELIRLDKRSGEIIKPFLGGKDVRRWHLDPRERWLIVTKIGVPIDRYPAIFAHLSRWKDELIVRQDQGNQWWELRACAYYSAFEKPKIVYPDIAKDQRFAHFSEPLYLGNTAYVIPVQDLYLLGVLNSQSVLDIYMRMSSQVRGGYLRYIRQYVERIPIPKATPADRNTIADLVQHCLDAKGRGPDVPVWEADINARVATLYGIT